MSNATIISSQRYLDDATVEAKREAQDYAVSYYDIELDGEEFRVIVDGHHSLAAAKADGVEAIMSPVPREIASEYDCVIADRGANAWLEEHQMDADYYDVATGINVF